MAKMTISQLQSFVATYVAAAKQGGAWKESRDNILKLLDKIGLQLTIEGEFQDKLPELSGSDLPYGKTIEEYFVDLTLPQDFDATGKNALAPAFPTVEDVAYSYTLGKKTIKTTEPLNNVERAALSGTDASNMIAKIVERLTNSYTLYTYAQKKQLLGNFASKAITAGLSEVVAIPTDAASGEKFIEKVKADVESASFASEGTSLGKALIGAAPSLVLYVKKGVLPNLQVQTMAGAFNKEDLAIPATVKVVDDFGNADSNVYAILVDPRGVKLHRGSHNIRSQENAEGEFINFYDHSENTGFISKNTFIKVYKKA